MQSFSLPYGKTKIIVELPDFLDAELIAPINPDADPDPAKAVENALDSPAGSNQLNKYKNARNAVIVINDKTRPVPHQHLLPPLLKKLHDFGLQNSQIKLLVATGTHLPMGKEEIDDLLPSDIVDNYEVITHNCDNQSNLINIGTTTRGTPVFINRQFFQADLKIVTGNIEPHHFMGFSGGAKSASIGVTGRETINKNHSMLVDPNARIGEYENNPMRQDVEEIGKIIGVNYALNAILNSEKKIVIVFAGDPIEVMEKGIAQVRKISQIEVKQPYDLVIASAGGHPKDINLYQSQKALTHSSVIVKNGGVVILIAACPEGSGSKSFEDFMIGVTTIEEAFKKFNHDGFRVGPHKAFQIAREAARISIILISNIEPEKVKKWFITPASNIQEAIDISLKIRPDIKKVAIMTAATNTIPVVT